MCESPRVHLGEGRQHGAGLLSLLQPLSNSYGSSSPDQLEKTTCEASLQNIFYLVCYRGDWNIG